LAGKNVIEMTYFVSGGTLNLQSIKQSVCWQWRGVINGAVILVVDP